MKRFAINPGQYRGRNLTRLREYQRLCAVGGRIGEYLDEIRQQLIGLLESQRILTFYALSQELGIPEEDVITLLCNRNGGVDKGITVFLSDV